MKKEKLYIALENPNLHINNKKIIYRLLENNDIDFLVNKIDNNLKVKVVCPSFYGKKFLNGFEHFLMILDAFINFYSNKLSINLRDAYFLGRIFLKSKYSRILLLDKYFLNNFDNGKMVYTVFDKMMTDSFLNNLLLMKYYIKPYLSNININLDKFDYSDNSYHKIDKLLVSLFLSNKDYLTVVITYIFIDMQNKKVNTLISTNKIVKYWKKLFSNI